MGDVMDKKQPSTLKYIGAWLLAGFISSLLAKILDLILSNYLVKDLNDLNTYFLVGAILTVPIASGSFIITYNLFKSLNIRKVMMYIYILGGLGTLVNFIVVTGVYSRLNVDISIFYFSYILAFLVSVYLIRSYFIKRPDRWY
jgi:hypothetical protein